MSKWDGRFDGSYGSSRYADRPFEKDIEDAMSGKYTYEDSHGNLVRQSDSRYDHWFKGDDKGHYDHYYYNGPNDYGKAPDGRHDK